MATVYTFAGQKGGTGKQSQKRLRLVLAVSAAVAAVSALAWLAVTPEALASAPGRCVCSKATDSSSYSFLFHCRCGELTCAVYELYSGAPATGRGSGVPVTGSVSCK